MRVVHTILAALFVLALVVFLITTNVRWIFYSLPLYELGFSRHQVSLDSGLTEAQLSEAARQLRDYLFSGSKELLDVRITVDGAKASLFNEREVLHMRDVKELIGGVFHVQERTFLYLFLYSTLGFFLLRKGFAKRLRRAVIQGSLLTLALVALVGLVSLVNFGSLFVVFHQISFVNDLWQLDPYTSYLVRMFPFGLWLDTTLLIGLASVIEALAAVAVLWAIKRWRERRNGVAQSKTPRLI